MTDEPLVSVIVATKNSQEFISACLASIKSQTYRHVEIIVVDNASSDKTKEVAFQYTKKVLNKGPERSAQRNFGAKHAGGAFLLFIDSDMELSKNVITSCVGKMTSDSSIKGIVIPEESFGTGFWSQCKRLERSFYVGENSVSWLEGARFFYKKIFSELKGYDEENTGTEDYDFPQRIKERYGEKSIARIEEFIYHNEGRLSLFRTMQKKYYYSKNLKIYRRKKANTGYFNKQANILERYKIFLSNPYKLFRNPIIGFGMIFMKTCEFAAGAAGYVVSEVKS